PPIRTGFPYTTLFRSRADDESTENDGRGAQGPALSEPELVHHALAAEPPEPVADRIADEHGQRGHRDADAEIELRLNRDAAEGQDRKSTRLNSSHQII